MTEHDDILSRLRGLASTPVDDAVAQRHLSALADAPVGPSGPSRGRRLVVMGAVVAGTLMGSATLAGAVRGDLPDTAQDVAHEALAKVGIDVPEANGKGKVKSAEHKADDTDGPGSVERFLEGCTNPDGSAFVGNHGQYVKAHEDDEATADVNEREVAAQSRCGKPVQAGEEEGGITADDADDDGAEKEDTGRPDSPGKSADHKPDDAGKPEDAGAPDSPGKSADHKPDGAGKPDDTDTDTDAD